MKWNNVKPDISAYHINDATNKWSFVDVIEAVQLTSRTPLIIIPDQVREKILHHISSRRVELGGLLVGSVVSIDNIDDGVVAVVIKDSVASEDFDSSSVSLSMSPAVWQAANKLVNERTFVVGWYHSHPNLGAFFSGVDRKTQKDFFNSDYNLGLVIDPIRKEEKWFVGADSKEVDFYHVRRELDGLALA